LIRKKIHYLAKKWTGHGHLIFGRNPMGIGTSLGRPNPGPLNGGTSCACEGLTNNYEFENHYNE